MNVFFEKKIRIMATIKDERITVVIPSTKKIEEKMDFLKMVIVTASYPIDIKFIENNTLSLTEVYQTQLDESPNDIIVFIHDDIEFLRPGWGKEIVSIFKRNPQYGIIGIAGTKAYGQDLAWWSAKKEDKFGMLFHGDEKDSWVTFFSDFNDKIDLIEVAVVDGVFMAVNREKIEYDFDTDIKGFHFYDVDFCLANFLSHKCRIGVTNKVSIRHRSPGVPNEEWMKNGQYVHEKYKNDFPIKVYRK